MSLVLYRKYRPKLWSEVIGQEHIVKTLQSAISSGLVAHSYLFTGSRGIGKTTIARLLAKTLNCLEPKNSESCGQCENCQAANLGNSLNIIEIDAASHTGVDNVREKIIENCRFASVGAKYKIFIIDEVHMLSGAAFNALLKTIEEPPAHIIFILATTELHKVPATILSRCQRFDFKKPTIKEIIERLGKISEFENVKVPKSILEKIACLAEGGMRDAEGLLGQLLSLGAKDYKDEDADLVLPKGDASAALKFLELVSARDGREALLLIQNLEEKGIDFKYFIDQALELVRKLLYGKITGDFSFYLPDEALRILSKIAGGMDAAEIIKIIDTLAARRQDARVLEIPSLPLELAAVELCGEERDKNLPSAISASSASISTPSTVIPAKPALDRDRGTGIPRGNLKEILDKWGEVLEKIKNYNHSLPFVLNSSKPLSFDGKNLTLAIKYKLHKEKLDDPKNKSILTEVLKLVYNKDILAVAEVDPNLDVSVPESGDEVDVENAFAS